MATVGGATAAVNAQHALSTARAVDARVEKLPVPGTQHVVEYSYGQGDDRRIVSDDVSQAEFARLRPGMSVRLLISPEWLGVVHPATIHAAAALFGGVGVLAWLLLPITWWLTLGRDWHDRSLTRDGVPVYGRVVARGPHSRGRVWVQYRYQSPDEPSATLPGTVTLPEVQAAEVADGEMVIVLADPRRPWRSVPYCLPVYRATVPSEPPPIPERLTPDDLPPELVGPTPRRIALRPEVLSAGEFAGRIAFFAGHLAVTGALAVLALCLWQDRKAVIASTRTVEGRIDQLFTHPGSKGTTAYRVVSSYLEGNDRRSVKAGVSQDEYARLRVGMAVRHPASPLVPGEVVRPESYRELPIVIGVLTGVVGMFLPFNFGCLLGQPLLHRRLVRRGVPVYGRVVSRDRFKSGETEYVRVRYAYHRPGDPAGPAENADIELPADRAWAVAAGQLVIVLADPWWPGLSVPYELSMYRAAAVAK